MDIHGCKYEGRDWLSDGGSSLKKKYIYIHGCKSVILTIFFTGIDVNKSEIRQNLKTYISGYNVSE